MSGHTHGTLGGSMPQRASAVRRTFNYSAPKVYLMCHLSGSAWQRDLLGLRLTCMAAAAAGELLGMSSMRCRASLEACWSSSSTVARFAWGSSIRRRRGPFVDLNSSLHISRTASATCARPSARCTTGRALLLRGNWLVEAS